MHDSVSLAILPTTAELGDNVRVHACTCLRKITLPYPQ